MVKEEGVAVGGEPGEGGGEGGVFAEAGVVEMKQGGGEAGGMKRAGCRGVRGRGVVEGGFDGGGEFRGIITAEDFVADPGGAEDGVVVADDFGDAARAQVVVDAGDGGIHRSSGPVGFTKWKPQTSKPRRK